MRALIPLPILTVLAGLAIGAFAESVDGETPEIVYRRYFRLLRTENLEEAKLLLAKVESFSDKAVEESIDNDLRAVQQESFVIHSGKIQGDCALVLVCEDSDVDPGYCLRVDGRWKVVPWDLRHPALGLTEKQKADFVMLKAWFKANELALKQKYTLPRRDR
jgi:hypothetical protein